MDEDSGVAWLSGLLAEPFQNTRIDDAPFFEHNTAQPVSPLFANCRLITLFGVLENTSCGIVQPTFQQMFLYGNFLCPYYPSKTHTVRNQPNT